MTLAVVLVVAAVLSLVVIVRVGVVRTLQVSKDANLSPRLQPLDVEAFRNLADPGEDAYLRRHLPASEFRRIRRTRLLAMASYVQTAGRNAGVLVLLAQQALGSADPQTSDAALQLLNQALLLRRNAAVVLFRLYFALAWPYSSLAAAPILDGYLRLSGAAMLLGRLQNPAVPVRISTQ